MSGPDHEASLEFKTYKDLTELGNKVYISLGNNKKGLKKSEKILHNILARRIVARKDIKFNEKLSFDKVKPVITKNRKAIYANEIYSIINKRVKRNIKKGNPINLSSIKNI